MRELISERDDIIGTNSVKGLILFLLQGLTKGFELFLSSFCRLFLEMCGEAYDFRSCKAVLFNHIARKTLTEGPKNI